MKPSRHWSNKLRLLVKVSGNEVIGGAAVCGFTPPVVLQGGLESFDLGLPRA